MEIAFKRVVVLIWADILAGYVIWIMPTYLTNVWKLDFTHASGIQNVYSGLTKVLPLFFLFGVDAFLGNYLMLVLSSITYTVGLGLLSMSTPPVLSKSTGTCSQYNPECLGRTQKALFYTSLALIAVGVSGHIVSLVAFASQQMEMKQDSQRKEEAQADAEEVKFDPVEAMLSLLKGNKSFRVFLAILVPVIGTIALPYVKPWSIRFGVPAICTLVATILFASGSCRYVNERKPQQSSLTTSTIRMIPFWITFVISGVITSIGNTYFVEQANRLNYRVGKLKVPITILLVFYNYSKLGFSARYSSMAKKWYGPAVGIMFAVFCCIIASVVESRRLSVIRDHGLLDKPDEKVPMTAFLLLPQYFFLAGHDSIFENSIAGFFSVEGSESMKKYAAYVTQGISGLGIVGSVLSVYIVGRVSERGGRTNWFQDTLNKSRLDNYYWVLAVLSAANFFWYLFAALRHRHGK